MFQWSELPLNIAHVFRRRKDEMRHIIVAVAVVLSACSGGDSRPANSEPVSSNNLPDSGGEEVVSTVRFATYNASLFRNSAGALVDDLRGGQSEQAQNIAAVVQTARPDVLLVNEFDWDEAGEGARIMAEEYFGVGQNGLDPIDYPYRWVAPSNTGVHSGYDLDQNGTAVTEPGSREFGNDAFGYGEFEGQYSFVVFSKHPIAEDEVRTFRETLWSSMPNNLLPTEYYGEASDALRLSSKNHAVVPVDVEGSTFWVLASHPTPPSFDGDEDRNGRRNHDEIRFWVDFLDGADWIVDDQGRTGTLPEGAAFAVAGDLNSDPVDGDSRREALISLLDHPLTNDTQPTSEGGVAAAERDGQANTVHEGDPALDTADFSDGRVGNLRVDYALPSASLNITESFVYWPVETGPVDASDHRLVLFEGEWTR